MPKAASSAGVKRATAARAAKAVLDRPGAMPEDQPMEAEGWTEGMDQAYELVDVDAIKEHPDNYNEGDEEAIRSSMDANGWFGAVLVQRSSGYIIAHNHAYRVAKQKGALAVPVIWKDVDDVEALRILVADNETARRSNRNQAKLDEILGVLGGVEGTGLRLEELAAEDEAREASEAAERAKKDLREGDEGEAMDTQYGLIVLCEDEASLEALYKRLSGEGLTVRPVSV